VTICEPVYFPENLADIFVIGAGIVGQATASPGIGEKIAAQRHL